MASFSRRGKSPILAFLRVEIKQNNGLRGAAISATTSSDDHSNCSPAMEQYETSSAVMLFPTDRSLSQQSTGMSYLLIVDVIVHLV